MNVKGSKEIVSLDRLKPAFVDTPISASDCLLPSTAPSSETITSETQEASTNFKTITRSGRGVKWLSTGGGVLLQLTQIIRDYYNIYIYIYMYIISHVPLVIVIIIIVTQLYQVSTLFFVCIR